MSIFIRLQHKKGLFDVPRMSLLWLGSVVVQRQVLVFVSFTVQLQSLVSSLLRRRERQDHPPDHKVEQEHRVHHQGLTVRWLAVGEESRGCESGPTEGRRDHDEAHGEADCARAAEQDQPAHDHGHRQRHDAVTQHTQALEEGDGPAQKLGVQGDDDGAEPDDDEDLEQRAQC